MHNDTNSNERFVFFSLADNLHFREKNEQIYSSIIRTSVNRNYYYETLFVKIL